MKTLILAALALTVLGTGLAEARPHRHQVCSFHHHHRVCHWR